MRNFVQYVISIVLIVGSGCNVEQVRIPCRSDRDCTAEGYVCLGQKTRDSEGVCWPSGQLTNCPVPDAGRDAGDGGQLQDAGDAGDDAGVNAGDDAGTTTDAGSDAGDGGTTECVLDAGQPVELAIENVNVVAVTPSTVEFTCDTTVVAQCWLYIDGAVVTADARGLVNHSFVASAIPPGDHTYQFNCLTGTDSKTSLGAFTAPPEPDLTNPVITTGSQDLTATTATIDFDPSEPLQSAQVFYGAGEGLNESQLVSGSNWTVGASNTFTLSGLTSDAAYSYQVRGVDVAGNLGKSTIKSFKTLKPVLPDLTPPFIAAQARDITTGSATITARSSEGLTNVSVEYSQGGVSQPPILLPGTFSAGSLISASVSGLAPNVTYSYLVKGTGPNAVVGIDSGTFTTLPVFDTTQPTVVISTASPATVSSNTLSFNGTATDDTGVISVTCANITKNASSCIPPSGTTSWTVGAMLAAGTTVFAIRAADAAKNLSEPAYMVVTYTPVVIPPDTTKPTVAVSTASPVTVSSNTLPFSGTALDDTGVTSVTCTNVTKNASTCNLTGTTSWQVAGATLVAGTTVFEIKALDAAGNPSEPAYMVATYVPPSGVDTTPPTILDVSLIGVVGTTGVTLKIVADESMQSFQVNYGTNATSLTAGPTAAGPGAYTTITLTGLDPGKLYYFQAVGKDVAGNVSSPNSNGKDKGSFMTWAVATGKYEFVCDWAAPSGCTVTVYYTHGSGFYDQGVRVSLTGSQICPPIAPVNNNPPEQVQIVTSGPNGADDARVFRPDGSPVLAGNGSPVLPRSGVFATVDRGVLSATAANCVAFKY